MADIMATMEGMEMVVTESGTGGKVTETEETRVLVGVMGSIPTSQTPNIYRGIIAARNNT